VAEKLQRLAFSKIAPDAPQLPPIFPTQAPAGTGDGITIVKRGGAMRDILEREIPDTAPYKEWLGIVGSMLVAVLICAVLFAGGVLT
jgi:hypothetical protein